MLTKEDLQAIAEIMDSKINTAIQASENRMKAYIESHVEKNIKQIAEGHMMLNDRLDRIENGKLARIENDLTFVKAKLYAHSLEIARR